MKGKSVLAAGVVGLAAVALRRLAAKEVPAPGEPALRRRSLLARALDPSRDVPLGPPVPPPGLPPGSIAILEGRGEMFYRHAGELEEATPVLLLHGWMASADLNWWSVADEISEHHPVIAPDHRGHGRGIRSPLEFSLEDCADDAAALLKKLGIRRALVVGYSMGGPVAMLLWRRHPELVAGLVLEATAMELRESWWERNRWRAMGLVAALLRYPAGRLTLARILGGRTEVPPPLVPHRAWIDAEFRRSDPTDLADAGRALGMWDARAWAPDIDVPISVVVTQRDSLVPAEKQRELSRVTGAHRFEFDGDHDSAIVQGEAFARVTLDALAALALSDSTPLMREELE